MAVCSSGTERSGRLKVRQAFGLDAFSIVVIHHLIGNLSQHTFSQRCRRGLCGRKDGGKDERKEYRWNLTLSCAWVGDTGEVSLLFHSVRKTDGGRPEKTQQDRAKNKHLHTHTHARFLAKAFVSDSQLHTFRVALYLWIVWYCRSWPEVAGFLTAVFQTVTKKAKQSPSLEFIAQEALDKRFNKSNEKPEDLNKHNYISSYITTEKT